MRHGLKRGSGPGGKPYLGDLIDIARYFRLPLHEVADWPVEEIDLWRDEFRRRPPHTEALILARILAALSGIGGAKDATVIDMAPYTLDYATLRAYRRDALKNRRRTRKAMLAGIMGGDDG